MNEDVCQICGGVNCTNHPLVGDVWDTGITRFKVLAYHVETYFVHFLGAKNASSIRLIDFEEGDYKLYERHGKRHRDTAALWESIYNSGIPRELCDLTQCQKEFLREMYGDPLCGIAFCKEGNRVSIKAGEVMLPDGVDIQKIDMVVNAGTSDEVSISLWRKE